MAVSRLAFPLRLSLRGARAALRTTRDVADLGLVGLEVVGRALGEAPPSPRGRPGVASRRAPRPAPPAAGNGSGPAPPIVAEDLEVAAPLPDYGSLRAAEVIARLPGFDATTLAAIERYEQSHRRRRTVLDAIAREARRRG